MTIDEAISHALEVAESCEWQALQCDATDAYENHVKGENEQCATDHRQLAEWLTELKQWRRVYGICPSYEMCIPECKEGYNAQIAEYKRLLKAAVEDFAKLDRENAKNKNCMMPEMDCADCPLSWDSVDDRVEPCHSWRYANEALALIGEDTNVPASAGDTNVGGKIDSWIRCKDKMPEDNTSVLFVYVSENGIKSVHYGYHQTLKGLGSSWAKLSGGLQYCDDDVTHWQPVPEPPKDGDAE